MEKREKGANPMRRTVMSQPSHHSQCAMGFRDLGKLTWCSVQCSVQMSRPALCSHVDTCPSSGHMPVTNEKAKDTMESLFLQDVCEDFVWQIMVPVPCPFLSPPIVSTSCQMFLAFTAGDSGLSPPIHLDGGIDEDFLMLTNSCYPRLNQN